MEGNAQSGLADHRQVVGTVAHGDGLSKVHLFHLSDELKQFGLAVSVDNLTHITASELVVVVDL